MNGAGAIDGVQLRALLAAFFRINLRGTPGRARAGAGRNWSVISILCFYTFFGAIISLTVFRVTRPVFYFLLLHGITFSLAGMAALVESGKVVFNDKEEDILGALPISSSTLVAAKMLNLAGFTFLLSFAFNLVPAFMALKLAGVLPWAPLVHIASLTLICVFCSSGVIMIYGLVARFVGRERYESIVNWAQVILSMFFIVGYQMLGPVLRQIDEIDVGESPWLWYLPPRWFAALDASLSMSRFSQQEAIGGGFAVMASLLLGWLGVTRLAAGRERQIKLDATRAAAKPRPRVAAGRVRPLAPWLRWWVRDPAERGAFRLAVAYMARDKEVRRRLFPSLAWVVVFPVYLLISSRHTPREALFYSYACFWLLATLSLSVMETLRMSEDARAAELFHHAPLASQAPLFHGIRKAALYYAALPCGILLMGLMWLTARRPEAMMYAAIPALLPIPTISLLGGLSGRYMPLSISPRAGDQSARSQGTMLISMIVLGVFYYGLHRARRWLGFDLLLAIEIPLIISLHFLLLRGVNRPHPAALD